MTQHATTAARDDELIPLAKAARELPGRPHPATLNRWCSKGLVVNGERVRLDVELLGRRIYVTRAALRAFSAALGRAYGAAWNEKTADASTAKARP